MVLFALVVITLLIGNRQGVGCVAKSVEQRFLF